MKQCKILHFLRRSFKCSGFEKGLCPGIISAILKSVVLFLKAVVIVLLLSPGSTLFAKDIIHISSDDIVEIDAKKRRLAFRNNVSVIQKSSGSSLKAKRLVVIKDSDENAAILEAEGGVKFLGGSLSSGALRRDLTITCEWLYFNREESLLRLKGQVVAESGEHKLEGDQFEYDSLTGKGRATSKDARQVVFWQKKTKSDSRFKGILLKRGFKGTADEIIINKPVRKVVLQGRVLIMDAENKSEFRAKRVEIFFNLRRQVKEVIASEGFSMRRPGQVSTAERAVFKYDQRVIFLSGDACVKGKDKVEIRSSGIQMFMESDKNIVKSLDDSPVKMKIPAGGFLR